jgi:DNA-binding response OmpR family regulator
MDDCVFLHADDDDSMHQMLQIAIEELNLPVRLYRAVDGEQTLAFLRKHGTYETAPQPDLVILDLYLPKKSGREILAEMRHDGSLSDIRTVVLSSSSLGSDRSQLMALGAEDYVIKPPTFTAFLEVVKALYSRVRGNPETKAERARG